MKVEIRGTDSEESKRQTAIFNLVGGNLSMHGSKVAYNDNQTPPTDSEIGAEIARLEKEYSDNEYIRKREVEYPSIQECVHAILDDDLTDLQEKRQAIKTKYPKS